MCKWLFDSIMSIILKLKPKINEMLEKKNTRMKEDEGKNTNSWKFQFVFYSFHKKVVLIGSYDISIYIIRKLVNGWRNHNLVMIGWTKLKWFQIVILFTVLKNTNKKA